MRQEPGVRLRQIEGLGLEARRAPRTRGEDEPLVRNPFGLCDQRMHFPGNVFLKGRIRERKKEEGRTVQ